LQPLAQSLWNDVSFSKLLNLWISEQIGKADRMMLQGAFISLCFILTVQT
jgi:hypothetical protein